MSYLIEVSEDSKYLRIVAKVNVTQEIALEWTKEIVELTKVNGIKKYLTDVRKVRNTSNITSNYNYSYNDLPKLELDRACRSAILVSPEDHSRG